MKKGAGAGTLEKKAEPPKEKFYFDNEFACMVRPSVLAVV